MTWKIRDLDCPWCHGTGVTPDSDDPTWSVDCLCVTHHYPLGDEPRLPGMTDCDVTPCRECGVAGDHKLDCSRLFQHWGNGYGYTSGY
jgi:hypothetical protein